MDTSEASFIKKVLVVSVAALSLLAGTAGPATATSPGQGTFAGLEYAPASELTNMATLCAKFKADGGDPLTIETTIAGTSHGSAGSGTAIFEGTTNYFANPEGTYSDTNCSNQASVPGTLTVTFTPVGGATQTCSAAATYERRATTVIEIKHTGPTQCNGALWTLNGGQEPCPITGCVVNDSSSVVEGVYSHT